VIIPGFLVSWLTFPGVIVHEFAHALFCRLFRVQIYEVKYMNFSTNFGEPSGWVLHEPIDRPLVNLLIGIGPLVVNTILGALISAPAAISVLWFYSGNPIDLLLVWLGVSVAMHAFPSIGDARSIWEGMKSARTPWLAKIACAPLVGLIYVGAAASFIWLDALYGVFVAGLIPGMIVRSLA
jgi:hypothetical protein